MLHPLPTSTLFPYTTLFRSLSCKIRRAPRGGYADLRRGHRRRCHRRSADGPSSSGGNAVRGFHLLRFRPNRELRGEVPVPLERRSEEHTSELQSRGHLVCRL